MAANCSLAAQRSLDLARDLRQDVGHALGHYPGYTDMANSTFGGSASFGGVTKRPQRTGALYPSAPELGWIKKQLDARNLSHVVGAIFLHDDDLTMTADTTHEAAYLHKHWPAAPGYQNLGTAELVAPDADAAALYRARQFVFSPEVSWS